MLKTALVAAIALSAAAAGFFAYRQASFSSSAEQAVAARLAELSLPDPAGKIQAISQWRGRILVLNFWATWCAPCREEIPGLVRIYKQYEPIGLQIVGIALDSASNVREYAKEIGINYPVVIGGIELIAMTAPLGNRASGLPFTIALDRSGKFVGSHLGVVPESKLLEWARLAAK